MDIYYHHTLVSLKIPSKITIFVFILPHLRYRSHTFTATNKNPIAIYGFPTSTFSHTFPYTTPGTLLLPPVFPWRLQSPLDHRFQIFVIRLKILKTQIIHIDDEFVIPVFDLTDDIV